jgi:hypothetical protein
MTDCKDAAARPWIFVITGTRDAAERPMAMYGLGLLGLQPRKREGVDRVKSLVLLFLQ